jgi:hypothetical protein
LFYDDCIPQTLLRGDCKSSVVDKNATDGERIGLSSDDEVLRCNICGRDADFIVQLELIKERSNYNIIESLNQMPFYLCKSHEFLYKRMRNNIELQDYFPETIKENR